ncbi:hypothetical protein AcW2_007325 [Taiwanofungus camphoratus]|nr:hypothetical protein AcW2_007325 [Antrodia cinnamomea]
MAMLTLVGGKKELVVYNVHRLLVFQSHLAARAASSGAIPGGSYPVLSEQTEGTMHALEHADDAQ